MVYLLRSTTFEYFWSNNHCVCISSHCVECVSRFLRYHWGKVRFTNKLIRSLELTGEEWHFWSNYGSLGNENSVSVCMSDIRFVVELVDVKDYRLDLINASFSLSRVVIVSLSFALFTWNKGLYHTLNLLRERV